MPFDIDIFCVGPSTIEIFVEIGLIVVPSDHVRRRRRPRGDLLDCLWARRVRSDTVCPETVLDSCDLGNRHVFALKKRDCFVGRTLVVVIDFPDAFEWPSNVVRPRCCSQYLSVNAVGMLVGNLERDFAYSFRMENIVCGESILVVRE